MLNCTTLKAGNLFHKEIDLMKNEFITYEVTGKLRYK